MLSSTQIAAMHAGQQQMFGAQQAYAQQLSAQMPQPYGSGLGTTGFGGGGFGAGGGFNYGGGVGGYGVGNSFGNRMTSAIGGVGHAFGSGMGIAGGLGGAYLGFRAGGMAGAFSGGMMGLGIGGMVGAGVQHVAGSMVEGAQEQASIERTLSQFQFQSAHSRTGRGFSRSDAMQIGNMVRQMERLPEMLTSFGELNRIMDKMGQMGLMQGVRDAGEFQKKFRETVDTLQTMAKMMGTSMEGAMKLFGESRMAGFYSKGDILRNTINNQLTGSLTGMGQDQVSALQRYGAEMGHATGGSRRTGAIHIQRSAAQLGMANQMGILTNDQIMEMTGKEGAEGIQELAAGMTQLGYRMSRSTVGQALTAALGKTRNGRFTGEMDEELVERVRSGEIGKSELLRLARQKVRGRGAKLSFAAHRERLRSEMAGSVGAEGIAMELQEILGERGWRNPDAINLVMQRFGASEEQANLLQQIMPNLQSIGGQMGTARSNEARGMARQQAMSGMSFDAVKHRISTRLKHATTDWAKDLGVEVRDYFQNWADEFVDDVTGQYRTYVTKRVSDATRFAAAGGIAAAGSLSMFAGRARRAMQLTGISGQGTRMDVGAGGGLRGTAARFMHWAGGIESSGDLAASVLGDLDRGAYLSREGGTGRGVARIAGLAARPITGGLVDPSDFMEDPAEAMARRGTTVLTSSFFGGATGVTRRNLDRAQARLRELGTETGALAEYQRLQKAVGPATLEFREAYQRAMTSGDVLLETDPVKRQQLIWKTMQREMGAGPVRVGEGGFDPSTQQREIQQAKDRMRFARGMIGEAAQAGFGGLQIVAAMQAEEGRRGRRYSGTVDFGKLSSGVLGGIDMDNQIAVSQAIGKLDKDLSKKARDTSKTLGWAEIKKMIDEGDPLATVLMGTDKQGGLLSEGRKGDRVRSIMARIAQGDLTPKDSELLQSMGIDPVALKKSINERVQKDPTFLGRLMNVRQAGISEGQLTTYAGLTDQSGLVRVKEDIRGMGAGLASRLSESGGELNADLAGKLELLRESQQGFQTGGDVGKVGDRISAAAEAINQIKDPAQRRRAEQIAGPEVTAAAATRRATRKDLSRRIGKAGVDEVLQGMGFRPEDLTGAEGQAFKKQVEGVLGENKKLDKGELETIVGMAGKAAGLRVQGGTQQSSKYVSEEKVASLLELMTKNQEATATILQNIIAGKPPGEGASAK